MPVRQFTADCYVAEDDEYYLRMGVNYVTQSEWMDRFLVKEIQFKWIREVRAEVDFVYNIEYRFYLQSILVFMPC